MILDRDGFRAFIATLTGLSDDGTVWATDAQPFISPADSARVLLTLFSITGGIDVDEHRRVYNAPGYPPGTLVTTETGNRTLRITVRAESFNANVEAAELLDNIRTRVRAESSTDALNALNLAFVTSHPSTFVNYVVDERVVNAAIADFEFAGIATFVSDRNADFIETVNTDNTVPGTLT